ncbi:MAG: hypothetical protein ABI761_16225 [Saprospiraceae bacterium]
METPLNPDEKKILRSNAHMDKVPHSLINQITTKMKNENLIQPPPAFISRSIPGYLSLILLAIGLLTAGYFTGKSTIPRSNATTSNNDAAVNKSNKSQFILFVHNDDTPQADPMQQVKEYSAWLKKIQATRMAGGEHLQDKGWILTSATADKIVQTKVQESFNGRNEVGGYFSFEAANQDEAVAIAKTCPHLNYNGTLELREVFQH